MNIESFLQPNCTVVIPPATYTVTETIVVPTNCRVIGTGSIIKDMITNESPLFLLDSVTGSSVEGFRIDSTHIVKSPGQLSLAYRIVLIKCQKCLVKSITFNTNASGISVSQSSNIDINDIDFYNMSGTCVKFFENTSSSRCSDIYAENISTFVIYFTTGANRNTIFNVVKNININTITAEQLQNNTKIDVSAKRMGLECVGLTRTATSNSICRIYSIGAWDNGMSISSDYNNIDTCICYNSRQDGFHIYGCYNICNNIVASSCGYAGIGLSSTTSEGVTTESSQNIFNHILTYNNPKCGIEIKGASQNNVFWDAKYKNNVADVKYTSATNPTSNVFL
jgi:hypothetical protein